MPIVDLANIDLHATMVRFIIIYSSVNGGKYLKFTFHYG